MKKESIKATEVCERISRLRHYMREEGLHAVIIPSTDPHGSEYVPDHWKIREWISGFDGSAGTAVIALERAALWTDSRYFLQAEEQLKDTGIALMKERMPDTPSITRWLSGFLPKGSQVGIDPTVNGIASSEAWAKELSDQGITLTTVRPSVWDELWEDRPTLPLTEAFVQPIEYSGEETSGKLRRIREVLGGKTLIVSALDDIAWTLNLRGGDVHCNPVVVSYLIIAPDEALFFAPQGKISSPVGKKLSEANVTLLPYERFFDEAARFDHPLTLLPTESNVATREVLPHATLGSSPIPQMKAVKNEAECNGYRRAMVRDGVAMVRFLRWLEKEVPTGKVTELSADRELCRLRGEQDLFKDISFDTIAAYGTHAAIVHYEPTRETDIPLEPKGFFLLDSGAQYQDGTTDITRTIPLGPLTEEERRDYTLVLKGHIALSMACFPQGTCGTQLDVLARQAMWREGMNYMHGTGHGVGSYLNVHEGPHQIRMNHMPTPLQPGMTVTNEPGIYKAGRHGVRTENMMLIVPYMETEFGAFYRFETLTLCPISLTPVVWSLLSSEETEWLFAYHQRVYNTLAPHLTEEEAKWLEREMRIGE